ncbi:MAG: ABC transporter permease [Chitinophagaceae bacterium]|nr:ABC transporter permease [Chitinophagaceae bacterium]
MFRNYLKVALRNLIKRPTYSLINILGLSIGISVCLLIVMFIRSELGFDSEQERGDRIYRMVVERKYPGRSTSYSFIPQSYAATVKQESPEVEEVVRIYNFAAGGGFQLKYGEKKFEERRVLFVDSTFFRVFSSAMIAGDASTALNKPRATVITETTAKRYFGSSSNAIGKMLLPEGDDNQPFEVTAVCADWQANSHFIFDLLITTAGGDNFRRENFVNFAAHTYLLLNSKATPQQVEARIPGIIKKFAAGNIEQQFAMSYSQFTTAGNGYRYYLQPLKKIHLVSQLEGELQPNGSMQAIYIFTVVAVFILLLACINFINLSTARSTERAREVGIRKTFGSDKKSLITQFLAESVLLSLVSMILAGVFVFFLLPLFNQLSGKELLYSEMFTVANMGLLLLFTIFTGLVAGMYPAFVLSSFRPIVVLKGKFKSGSYGLALRNGLVVFQFSISVVLIICTIIVNSQMQFMTSDQLGFSKEHTIIVQRTDLLRNQRHAFRDEVLKISGVEMLSGTTSVPGIENFFGISWLPEGQTLAMTGRGIIVDPEFAKTLNLEVAQGRFFSRDFLTDSLAVVLNERAVTELGLKNPIGTRLTTPEDNFNGPGNTPLVYTVIGVVKDFHYQSLHKPITPLVFTLPPQDNALFLTAIKIKANNFNQTVQQVEEKWKTFVKDRPFQYTFLDKTVEDQYQAESKTKKIFSFFSSLAIFIACIGLLGLAAYATQQRLREISIRKVLGATPGKIMTMLSVDFMKLVLIATLLACPLAWYVMHKWLQEFAYRIDIAWWVFVIAGALAILVALLTISFQAIKASISNPIKSLRSE